MTAAMRVGCAIFVMAGGVVPLIAQAQTPAATLTIEEQVEFLRAAEIEDVERINIGTTGAQVATLTNGQFAHDAQIQTFDESRPSIELGGRLVLNFVDSWRYNVAAFEVARLLNIDNVPVSVARRVGRADAAVTWWIDDVAMSEQDRVEARAGGEAANYIAQQLQRMYVFDALIWNWDRNRQNMLWSPDWRLWMIDHTRAFRFDEELRSPDELRRIERAVLEGMRALTAEGVAAAVGDTLTDREIEALLARRDLLVAHYDARIAEFGEDAILYAIEAPS